MDRVIFENVRCFRGRHEAPLRPLTVLVGENSSGKTTFLALVRLAWDVAKLRPLDFNEEPFNLGAFDQIARTSPEGQKSTETFSIGGSIPTEALGIARVVATFCSRDGQPARNEWSFESPELQFTVRNKRLNRPRAVFEEPECASEEAPRGAGDFLFSFGFSESYFLGLSDLEVSGVKDAEAESASKALEFVREALGTRPYAFAPVRSRPSRTYDPVKDTPDPEGAHVPMILRGALAGGNGGLAESLAAFGRASGLFDSVEIRRLGESSSDPFQVQIRFNGAAVNLIDVGYGVSQILPIIVDCVRGKEGGTFLLQQPEVHLHPKAQAELATFLGTLAKAQRKRFVVETHSDYLVDRIRMDLRDGRLKPEDVALLYFERVEGEARIHHLELDEQGNLLDVPPGYRSFFLEEARRFLGS